jgi:hypothetical protein
MARMTSKHFLFQTPDERLANLNAWAARDYSNFKLVDGLADDAEAQARKRTQTLGLPRDSEASSKRNNGYGGDLPSRLSHRKILPMKSPKSTMEYRDTT